MRHSIFIAAVLLVLSGVRPVSGQSLWQNQIAITGGPQWAMGPVQDIWKSGSGFALTY